jgi:hypothetical protein
MVSGLPATAPGIDLDIAERPIQYPLCVRRELANVRHGQRRYVVCRVVSLYRPRRDLDVRGREIVGAEVPELPYDHHFVIHAYGIGQASCPAQGVGNFQHRLNPALIARVLLVRGLGEGRQIEIVGA